MTPRQHLLFQNHLDLAQFSTNAKYPVFAVLDLEDSHAFEMAIQLERKSSGRTEDECRAALEKRREIVLGEGSIPAQTALLDLEQASLVLTGIWKLPALKPIPHEKDTKSLYVMIVSDGRCMVVGNKHSTAIDATPKNFTPPRGGIHIPPSRS
jgi:hypothetical protein